MKKYTVWGCVIINKLAFVKMPMGNYFSVWCHVANRAAAELFKAERLKDYRRKAGGTLLGSYAAEIFEEE